ncbi:MAG TPA: hypothetical protein VLX44_04495 [Xanthobacteraceae bacterium]|nr:hypothetical protein [Xanthobacteraceae bacterium]
MGIRASHTQSFKGNRLRLAGVGIVLIAAIIHVLLISFSLWNHPGDSCGHASWGEWLSCLRQADPGSYKLGLLQLSSWFVAGIGLLLGCYLTPYVSAVVPGAVGALTIWLAAEFVRRRGAGPTTPGAMILFAEGLGTGALLLVGPVTGAWLVGFGMLRRRRSKMQRVSPDVFD